MSAAIHPTATVPATAAKSSRKPITRHAPTVARVVLGLAFFVFGLDGFLHFIPPPPPGSIPQGAGDFALALMATKYMLPLIKGTELVAGTLLLANRFVPLALTVLAPVVVNILAFHAFLAPSGIVPGLVVAALGSYLAWHHRAAFRPVLSARPEITR
jgi:uncharacterized membrane protein YphA (DoxX/SURF4 family)